MAKKKTVTKKTVEKKNKVCSNQLTVKEVDNIRAIRDRGFAVVIFTEEELQGAEQERVEDRLVELGWDVINDLS